MLDLLERQGSCTPLILAAQRNNKVIVKQLLDHGADLMLKDHLGGGTAILRAVDFGCTDVVELMQNHGLNLYCLDDDRSLMHAASAHGWPKLIRLLRQVGLDLNGKDINGIRPMHEASQSGAHEVPKVLLELGEDPTLEDNFGRTPFKVAWQHGHVPVMNILRDNNAELGHPISIPKSEELPI